jgi:hypothetical protein
MKVRLSALCARFLYPQEDSWYLFQLDIESSAGLVRLEVLGAMKNPLNSWTDYTVTFPLILIMIILGTWERVR